jgi:NADPH2:quinone reductase
VNMQQWNWRGIDVINAHERDPGRYVAGIREAIDRMVSGGLDPKPLLTHEFPLDQLGTALDMTDARPDGFMKAIITS